MYKKSYPKIKKYLQEIIKVIGDDPAREGLKDTPERIIKSWTELYSGYKQKLDITCFTAESKEMVIFKDIDFFSTCEHNMLPFFGKIHIGYIPNKKYIGASKASRITEFYSRRLQIQERITSQIADYFMEKINVLGAIVICEATHFCMTSRGVKKNNKKMITSAIRGNFENQSIRQEFLELIT
jgi:GTP cyclohydrolase I